MASKIADELRCPMCLNIYKDPVMLKCTHSICRLCLRMWWEQNPNNTCPVCRNKCHVKDVSLNLILRNVCDIYTKHLPKPGTICSLHEEELKLFCLDHQECICLICKEAHVHVGHKFCPTNDVAQDHKKKLEKFLETVKEKQQDLIKAKNNCSEQAAYIKVQTKQVEKKIKMTFRELREFLHMEEGAKLVDLMEEERRKSQMMKEKIETLRKDIDALSDIIRATEQQLTLDHILFMNNYKTAMSKIQQLPDQPKPSPGALLDEAEHLGNLKFTVWKKMKKIVSYSPVILDPNTATSNLSLSEDLTIVSCNGCQQRPVNPERCKYMSRVLGCTLNSGTHVWDVDVGDSTDWVVGVVGGDSCLPHSNFLWGIIFCDNKYQIFSLSSRMKDLSVKVKVQRIRVHVDTNAGSISFLDSLTKDELYTCKNIPNWPNLYGKWMIYPYMNTNDKVPLKIIPLNVRVTTQIQSF
ncbi:E3 ubiquitin-protein ligase TRIM35-like [Syngnathus typhle]|uniref:E3 ubiquitin-protein ligase TRIM35-like n=1 Tax=Syngnathus typhle TaxID=161592 RepID=UPI002A6B2777|nr:E3 ubiquitin-protein ligase TRIM35-like [Syngnathus typhle]